MNRSCKSSLIAAGVAALFLGACGGGSETPPAATSGGTPAPTPHAGPTRISVGEALFNEPALSAGGQQACSSCHADTTAHADPSGTQLPMGGPLLDRQGTRSSPSLLYLDTNMAFRFVNNKPVGGFTWDGRHNTRTLQAAGPLLDASEMAHTSISDVASAARQLPYYADLAKVYFLPSTATDQQVFDAVTQALGDYQAEGPDYLLFNSKFDRFLDRQATLTPQESRGLALFNDPAKGNCASCHTSQTGTDRSRPLFTNFGYAATGLPRNAKITANADPNFFDMGLCGPKRKDLADRLDLCGQFKIPTLRNIAVTAPYFHNASVTTLEAAIGFYATRDINPARWYPMVNGQADKFNDLPQALRTNVIRTPPFDLAPGAPPRLTPQDVSDIAAFLHTLTDDFAAPSRSKFVAP
jgi:cytochrome c peroxidase